MRISNHMKLYFVFILLLSSSILADDINPHMLGDSAKISGDKLTISLDFLSELEANPTIREWENNYWELIHLLNLGSVRAKKIGFYILATSLPRNRDYDHDGLDTLARSLSRFTKFWEMLAVQKPDIIDKVVDYYDRNPMDYSGEGAYFFRKKDYLKQENWGKTLPVK